MGWVCETGNVLKDYNFPGMLGKMHACIVSVYKALKKNREPGYEATYIINCYDSFSQIMKIICGTLYCIIQNTIMAHIMSWAGVGVGLIHEL